MADEIDEEQACAATDHAQSGGVLIGEVVLSQPRLSRLQYVARQVDGASLESSPADRPHCGPVTLYEHVGARVPRGGACALDDAHPGEIILVPQEGECLARCLQVHLVLDST